MKTCECCGVIHDGNYGSGRFCCIKCARAFSTKEKREEINQKVSVKMAGGLTTQQRVQRANAKKHAAFITKVESTSILDVSSRTVRKILMRMKLPCSSCGWYVEGVTCDLHHILPRSQGGTDEHANIAHICPNCHRMVHSGKIKSEDLVSFQDIVGDDWKPYYFTKSET